MSSSTSCPPSVLPSTLGAGGAAPPAGIASPLGLSAVLSAACAASSPVVCIRAGGGPGERRGREAAFIHVEGDVAEGGGGAVLVHGSTSSHASPTFWPACGASGGCIGVAPSALSVIFLLVFFLVLLPFFLLLFFFLISLLLVLIVVLLSFTTDVLRVFAAGLAGEGVVHGVGQRLHLQEPKRGTNESFVDLRATATSC